MPNPAPKSADSRLMTFALTPGHRETNRFERIAYFQLWARHVATAHGVTFHELFEAFGDHHIYVLASLLDVEVFEHRFVVFHISNIFL